MVGPDVRVERVTSDDDDVLRSMYSQSRGTVEMFVNVTTVLFPDCFSSADRRGVRARAREQTIK